MYVNILFQYYKIIYYTSTSARELLENMGIIPYYYDIRLLKVAIGEYLSIYNLRLSMPEKLIIFFTFRLYGFFR